MCLEQPNPRGIWIHSIGGVLIPILRRRIIRHTQHKQQRCPTHSHHNHADFFHKTVHPYPKLINKYIQSNMFTNQSTDLSLGAPCRAIDAVHADKINNFWIAGTSGTSSCSNPQQQQQQQRSSSSSSTIQVLQFHTDINEIVVTSIYPVDAPVRCVTCSPYDPQLVLIASEQRSSVTLYRLPPLLPYDDDTENHSITTTTPTNNNYNNNNNNNNYSNQQQYNRDTSTTLSPENLQTVATLLPEGGFGATGNGCSVAWKWWRW
jgi:hypothetical protein